MNESYVVNKTLFAKGQGLPVPSTKYPNSEGEKPVSPNRNLALSHRIISDSGVTSIISTQGMDFRMSETLNDRMQLWQSDPNGDRFATGEWMKLIHGGFTPDMKCYKRSDENKLWNFLEEVAKSKEVLEKFGEINLKNLTPYQSLFLITDLIKSRMKYDQLAGLYTEDVVDQKKIKTIAELQTDQNWLSKVNSKKDLKKLSRQRYQELNKQTAEELLENGWGICGDFSAIASHLYDLLKERQEGLGLNGSYLLYWSEGSTLGNRLTETADSNLFEKHARNLLVVTKPSTSEGLQTEVGVVDYTFSLGLHELIKIDENSNTDKATSDILERLSSEFSLDQTFTNLPTGIAFIKNFGHHFGIKNTKSESVSLAESTLDRIDRKPDTFIDYFGYDLGLNMYSSLITLSKSRERGTVIEDLTSFESPSIQLAEELYSVPALSMPMNGVRHIRKEFIKGFSDYLDKINFKLSPRDTRREETADLFAHMIEQYYSRYKLYKNKLVTLFKDANYDFLLKQIIRIIVNLGDRDMITGLKNSAESRDFLKSISAGIKASNRVHKGLIDDTLVREFNSIIS